MTIVARFQIRRYVGRTATVSSQSGIENSESTAVGTRALGVHEVEVVLGTAEVAVVAADTSAEFHSAVERRLDDDDVVVGARGAEHVRLTELLHLSCTTHTFVRLFVV